MSSNLRREEFPGWRSGQGAVLGTVEWSLAEIAHALGLEIFLDQFVEYIWLPSVRIGDYKIVAEPHLDKKSCQIYVDISSHQEAAKEVVQRDVLSMLPGKPKVIFEDKLV